MRVEDNTLVGFSGSVILVPFFRKKWLASKYLQLFYLLHLRSSPTTTLESVVNQTY